MVKEEQCENVVGIRRASDILTVVLLVSEDVLRLNCRYTPQKGKSLEEKSIF